MYIWSGIENHFLISIRMKKMLMIKLCLHLVDSIKLKNILIKQKLHLNLIILIITTFILEEITTFK